MTMSVFLTLLIVSLVHSDGGVMNVDLFATRDCNLTVIIGDVFLPLTMYDRNLRHFSYHTSDYTYDDHLPLTFRVDGSDDLPQTIMFPLVSNYTYETLDFSNVSFSFRGSYTCEYGMESKRCAGKPTPAVSHSLSPPPVTPITSTTASHPSDPPLVLTTATTSTTTTSPLITTSVKPAKDCSPTRKLIESLGKLLVFVLVVLVGFFCYCAISPIFFFLILDYIYGYQSDDHVATGATENGNQMNETNNENEELPNPTLAVNKDAIV